MSFLEKIFSIKNDNIYKVICIGGIKIKLKNKTLVLKKEIGELKSNLNVALSQIYIYPDKRFSATWALDEKYVSTAEEYYKDVENLKKGLDKEALDNFNTIYNRIMLAQYNNRMLLHDFFSPYELNEIRKAKLIKYHVEDKGDYFQYKNYKLPFNRFDYAIFEKKQCLPHIKTLNSIGDKTIIDAGGFLGDTALIMREFTNAPIVTFEPVKKHFEYCLKTKELNNIQNYKAENFALGEEDKISKIYIDINYPGASNISGNTHNRNFKVEECKVVTLDNYVKENNITVGLIKTDVEGFEQKLLNGAIETIKTQKPILLISIYHNYHDFFKIKPWLESFNLGYKFNIVKDMDEDYTLDIYLIAEVY